MRLSIIRRSATSICAGLSLSYRYGLLSRKQRIVTEIDPFQQLKPCLPAFTAKASESVGIRSLLSGILKSIGTQFISASHAQERYGEYINFSEYCHK
jgi:hypothetical protein